MYKKPTWMSGLMAALGLSLGLTSLGVGAQESVVLKVEHFMPASAAANAELIVPWCADLEQASQGRLKCEIYPSMQLGGTPSQLPDLLRNGVIDMAFTAFGYSPGRFPRAEVMELPLMLPQDLEKANAAMWEFMNTDAAEDVREFKMLGVFVGGDSNFHTARHPIRSMQDLKGLRMRAATRAIGKFLSAMGAAPVSMPPSQISDAMSKGVLDGVITVWELLPATKLDETSFEHTEMAADQSMLVASPLTFLMNKERYASLPDDLRAILDEHSGPALNARAARMWDATARAARESVEKKPGHHVYVVDDAFYADMQDKAQIVYDDWVQDSAAGVDRAQLLQRFKALVSEATAEH